MKGIASVQGDRPIGPVNRRLFGSFVEHMGRCVYGGIYEPDHPCADADGFRTDVLDLVRELGVTIVRYPGGNFVSGYQWEDGVGPKSERPRRLDLAWHSTETNEFGLDEFVRWARRAQVEPLLAVNLGVRGVGDAVALLEYVNHAGGTARSEQRIANGSPEPHAIRMWCLGNEMDGPWQIGHKTAAEYGRLAAETARAMRMVDPSLELVACGSSGPWMPTFIAWEREVLEATYDQVDYVSLHAYFEEEDGDLASFLASGVVLDRFIERVIDVADEVAETLGNPKRLQLSVDEWNVWYQRAFQAQPRPAGWPVAPRLIEDEYSVADAVVVGGLLISLLKHADRVTCACLAQLVNVIAPIRSEPGGAAWRQTTFFPFAMTAGNAAEVAVPVVLDVPRITTAAHGSVPAVDAVATIDPRSNATTLFLVNRSPTEAMDLRLDVAGGYHLEEHLVLADEDPYAGNTMREPERVAPRRMTLERATKPQVSVSLPPVSWSMVRLVPAGTGARANIPG